MEKANILVVDDDKEIAELVGIHLREEGYEVYKAYSGKEALEIFKQERIDLVILDVMMPVMDGNQVCSKIRVFRTEHYDRHSACISDLTAYLISIHNRHHDI